MKKILQILLILQALVQTMCMQLEYIEIPVEEMEVVELEEISSSSSFEEEAQSSSSSEAVKLQMGRYELEYRGVSYYDAIIICNKMSIEEGLDTIYKHDRPIFIEDSLFWLPNIVVLENRSGYRLPTKEEWIFAKESGEIEKLYENVSEWLYGESGSEYSVFEQAPNFYKTVGLYRERDGYPAYGIRVVKVE